MQPDASGEPGAAISEPRRVRITDAAGSQFRGLEGRVIATHSRMPCSRVELDKLPDGCTSRRYWFAHDRLEWL